ncbi:hypothetical protein CTAYLR_002609 [Chrysophaeum taylorii]|uniref:Low temperature requirement protein A n=1 Tax=Chrysophaeum taylorii TaxID=2483200 RepID=A0AAD7XKG7_9STRA|nr:hypothetical protein CTAYLR_002609 [Chrysophaeum taylorii]
MMVRTTPESESMASSSRRSMARHRGMSTAELFRPRDSEDAGRVSFVELFYDLVFVFSIVQLSHTMSSRYTPRGIAETSVLILAVWWVWIYTTWVTNWLNPESLAGRVLMFALMGGGLILSSSIPEAYGSRKFQFAGAHVAIQFGRSLYVAALMRWEGREVHALNFFRIAAWLGFAGIFWLAGAGRLGVWCVALAIEYVGPFALFWVPGLGASEPLDWDVLGDHMAERCALFVIICLGETILATGQIFAASAQTIIELVAFLVAFATSVALWWTYFRFSHRQAARLISETERPGEVARLIFTFAHVPIVAGVIVAAVGMRFVLADPRGTSPDRATAVAGGPLVFLAGSLWFKSVVSGQIILCHAVGVFALTLLFVLGFYCPLNLLHVAAIALAALLAVAFWEHHFEHSKPRGALVGGDDDDLVVNTCNIGLEA